MLKGVQIPKRVRTPRKKQVAPTTQVFIVSPHRFNNEILSCFIEEHSDIQCFSTETVVDVAPRLLNNSSSNSLLLYEYCPDQKARPLVPEQPMEGPFKDNHTPFAIFNFCHKPGLEMSVIQAGARGVFYQDDTPKTILKGINAILAGEVWVKRSVLAECVYAHRDSPDNFPSEDPTITKREAEILALIALGAKNEDIADNLCISNHTVKTHVYNIYKKIGVPNRLQAALWAAKHLN